MKKRFISILMSACMGVLLLGGCGQNNSAVYSKEGTEGTESTLVVEQDSDYEYEQELNIIDDNYRNYYEIFVYSFYDTNGDGIGDLNGVTKKLDYIKDMGFNGIWLMPIMPSTTYHKYDVVDYYNIDEEYGTLEDFKNLLKEAHDRDIRVIIDFVMNHSSKQNPWFQEACSYLRDLGEGEDVDIAACPYVDYYHFSKENQSGYRKVAGADWYYEGQFDDIMPDLNLESQAVRDEFEKIADFWIDLGVDGFRMDAAMHFDEENLNLNLEVLNWFYNYCLSKNPEFYMVSEVWASEATIANYYESQTPSMFNFAGSSAEGVIVKTAMGSANANKFVDAMIDYQTTYSSRNPNYIDAPFLTNHDQVRVANNLIGDEEKLKMAAGLLLTMSGSPFVYYGEEIGMKSAGKKDENKRLPMFWSSTDLTGMTSGPKDADKGVEMNFPAADEQILDKSSLLNYYKRALRIRNENPEIARGTIEKIEALCDGHQAAITKTYNGSVIGIVYNTSEESMKIDLTGTTLENMAMRGYMTVDTEGVLLEEHILNMPARSICILK